MALTNLEKIDIANLVKNVPIISFSYQDFIRLLHKRRKVKETEIFEYFVKYVVENFRKNDKIYPNILKKYILTINEFLKLNHKSGLKVEEDLLDYIRNFKDLYNEYLCRTNFKLDDFIEGSIMVVSKTINELYPKEEKSENNAKHITRILDLEERIKKLNKELSDIKTSYENLQRSCEDKDVDLKKLTDTRNLLESDIKTKENEIKKLMDTITLLNQRLIELEISYKEIVLENENLSVYSLEIEKLRNEIERLTKVIKEQELLQLKEKQEKEREKEIEKLIYHKILFEKVSIDEILKYLNEHGIVSDKEEVSKLLRKIRTKISITSGFSENGPTYKVMVPRILKNGRFTVNIPNGTNCYDIMLVSDFHLQEITNETLNLFDILNNYCVINGINLVLNLGDFFDGDKFDYDKAVEIYNLLDEVITKIPKVDNLYHAILGGNHEKKILRYGFDPLETLASEREDFLNLGYTHSTVLLNDSSNTLGCFDIHHPDSYDFKINIADGGVGVKKYLNDIYNMQQRDRNDSYIDIIGHVHKNQMNYLASYYFITSFMNRINSGACHLKIYFDKGVGIKYMVFMPLNITDRLVKNNEIVYQKVK